MYIDTTSKETRAEFYNSNEWKEKRERIKERDNNECVWCRKEGKVTTNSHEVLEVDHIKELAEHPELALEDDNLRTLCKDCHNKRHGRMNYRHTNKKENKWSDDERWD